MHIRQLYILLGEMSTQIFAHFSFFLSSFPFAVLRIETKVLNLLGKHTLPLATSSALSSRYNQFVHSLIVEFQEFLIYFG
jgi:hypothetical protein